MMSLEIIVKLLDYLEFPIPDLINLCKQF